MDGAVRRKLPHVRHGADRLPGPRLGVAIGFTHPLLARNVRPVVGEQQIVVAATAQKRLDDVSKQARVLGAEEPVANLVERSTQLGVLLVVLPGVVVRLERVYLGGSEAEDKDIVVAYFFANLDVGAVHRANGEGTVEGELHVARAGGLGPSGRDLL